MLNGRTLDDVNGVGEAIRDETFLILLNPHHEPIRFYMPRVPGTAWEVMLDSGDPTRDDKPIITPGEFHELIPRSTALLRELRD
jgi:glycogen operon protein